MCTVNIFVLANRNNGSHIAVGLMWMLLSVCSVLQYQPRDWLWRTSPIWPSLCRAGRETLTQSISLDKDAFELKTFDIDIWHAS